jgi:hypothetical protein
MFGLVSKKGFLNHLMPLLGANGVDFKSIIAKTRSASVAKANEAQAIKKQADVEAANAQAEYDKVVASAQSALDSANKGVDVKLQGAAKIEAESAALAKSADYFTV